MTVKKLPRTTLTASERKTLRVPEQPTLKRKLPALASLENARPTLASKESPLAAPANKRTTPALRSPALRDEGGPVLRSPAFRDAAASAREESTLAVPSPEPPRLGGAPARRTLPKAEAGGAARRGLGEGGRAKTNKLTGSIRALRQKKTK